MYLPYKTFQFTPKTQNIPDPSFWLQLFIIYVIIRKVRNSSAAKASDKDGVEIIEDGK